MTPSTATWQTLLFEATDDGVATITLNRPDRLNAFNRAMADEFVAVWQHVRESAAIRAVVLRAAGARAFCAGVDVKEGGWGLSEDDPFNSEDPGTSLGPKQNRVWKPVITAVQGMTAGGAFYWINESDIVICAQDAQFFDPHVTFGQVSAVEPAGLLGRLPYPEIMRMVLMGNDERMSASTALRLGLVSEVMPTDQLWPRAQALAAAIAAKPTAAIQGSVRALWEARNLPADLAVRQALKFCQLGNKLGMAEIDKAQIAKARWTVR